MLMWRANCIINFILYFFKGRRGICPHLSPFGYIHKVQIVSNDYLMTIFIIVSNDYWESIGNLQI